MQQAAERDVFQEARVRLGRARRLVAAAESALAILLDQVAPSFRPPPLSPSPPSDVPPAAT